jgi:hypothetical protein
MQHAHIKEAASNVDDHVHMEEAPASVVEVDAVKRLMRERRCERKRKRAAAAAAAAVPSADTPLAYPQSGGDDAAPKDASDGPDQASSGQHLTKRIVWRLKFPPGSKVIKGKLSSFLS